MSDKSDGSERSDKPNESDKTDLFDKSDRSDSSELSKSAFVAVGIVVFGGDNDMVQKSYANGAASFAALYGDGVILC